jgi:peptidoglycan/xylan/chitin deacetylase (PgdA/CDA1 family)
MNAKLFINYRREDTAPYAGRLYDRLTAHFGEDQVFIDIDQIEPGEDFVEVINRKVGTCDIAIVAIGPRWLSATDASGKRRLDDEEDFVRMEIVAALQRNIRVIPVLVGGAQMPRKQDLPEALAPLSRRNAIELSETRFHADVNRLIEAIEKSFAVTEKRVEFSAKPATPPPEPEKSQQDSIVTVNATTPFKSTQMTPATTALAPSTSSISASKEPALWRRKRLIIVTAGGATVLLLVAIAAFLTKPHPPVRQAASASPEPAFEPAVAAAAALPSHESVSKPAVQTTPTSFSTASQIAIFTYHRLVDTVRYPGTEIMPAVFEAQMKELKDKGITVISMQDLLAWKGGKKNIPPRCAVITFDDGWKSQYEVAWPILKKFGYPLTMFIYTEGVRGGSLGGGEAITWEQLADMRNNGVDIQAHSATHQDLREGHLVMVIEPDGTRTRKKLTGADYEKWVRNEVVGCKELLEQRLGIKVNCYAVPFGNYNDYVKGLARNAGYKAMFTLYGQPVTFTSQMDSIGRYAIEANKPKVFEDAVRMIGGSSEAAQR